MSLRFDIDWGWLPIRFEAPTFFLRAFFARSENLLVLSLEAQIRKLQALLPLTGSFEMLEELNLAIAAEQVGIEETLFAGSLTSIVAPFINRLTPTLQALSIRCRARTDYSDFFSTLEVFPLLRKFSLCIAFHRLVTRGPLIANCIRVHSATLQQLTVGPFKIWPEPAYRIGQSVLRKGLYELKIDKL